MGLFDKYYLKKYGINDVDLLKNQQKEYLKSLRMRDKLKSEEKAFDNWTAKNQQKAKNNLLKEASRTTTKNPTNTNNAVLSTSVNGSVTENPEESGRSMTGGDWAGIGLQLLGAVSQQRAQDAEMKRQLREADQNKMNENKLYRDERGDIEDQKARKAQDIRFQGLNFLNDQVDSNRAMARKRTFRDAMYDSMRA